MRKLLVLLLFSSFALAQYTNVQKDTITTQVSGTVLQLNDTIGALSNNFEYLITGAPATLSVVLAGCYRGGTCDTLETYSTVANSIRKYNGSSGPYDYYKLTPTWTGGTNVKFVVNRTGTLAKSTSGGGITNGAGNNVVPKSDDTNLVASLITDNGTLVTITGNAAITGNISIGSSIPTACGTATSCWAFSEAGTPATPTAGQDAIRYDATIHGPICTFNNSAEFNCYPPANTTATANQFFTAFNSATGAYTKAQPSVANLSDGSNLTRTIASGAKALATGAITTGTCTSAQTATATGTLTTDTVVVTFNADTTAVTGYAPVVTGGLYITFWPTADTVNFKVCNPTTADITPGAVTANWRVPR